MAKNNCCRICGKLDYDDDGEYLICRVCGEKRRKRWMPWTELFFCILFFLCGGTVIFFASAIRSYRLDNTMQSGVLPSIKPNFNASTNKGSEYNSLEFFFRDIEPQLVWIEPVLWIIGLALWIVAAFFIKKMYDASRKIIV